MGDGKGGRGGVRFFLWPSGQICAFNDLLSKVSYNVLV